LNELQALAVAGSVAVFFPVQRRATNGVDFSTKTLSFASSFGMPFGAALAKIQV